MKTSIQRDLAFGEQDEFRQAALHGLADDTRRGPVFVG